jgi:hypothetical protein
MHKDDCVWINVMYLLGSYMTLHGTYLFEMLVAPCHSCLTSRSICQEVEGKIM